MGFTHQDATDANDNSLVVIKGATDNTSIGNVADRLKVDAQVTGVSSGASERKTFVSLASAVAIGNNKSMFSILNAAASGVVVRIEKLYLINSQTTAITGVISDFRFRRITGHSAGTSITPLTHDTADTLSASVTTRAGSTVAGEVASDLYKWVWSSDEWGVGALDVEGSDHNIQYSTPLYQPFRNEKPLTIRAGEGFTLKHIINSTAGTFDIVCVFTEATS